VNILSLLVLAADFALKAVYSAVHTFD